MIKIKHIPNRFKTEGVREYCVEYKAGMSLKECFATLKDIPKIDFESFDVIVTGKNVKSWGHQVRRGDAIIITPKVEVETLISLVAYAVSAFGVTSTTAIAIANVIVYGSMIAMMAYSVYSAYQTPSMPSFGTTGGSGLDEGSPTYGWEGVRTTRDVGIPMPIVYGEHLVGGNVINEYIWTDGDKNYLNTLIALGEGEIESITGIKINDNPVANYSGIEQYTRMGTNSQSVIAHFQDLHNVVNVGVQLLKDSAYVYTTIDDDVEAFEVKLSLSTGLFSQSNTTGEIGAWAITYKIEYKLTSAGSYTDLGSTTISGKSRSVIRRVFRKEGLTAGKYDIRITKTSANSSFYNTGDLYLTSVDEINTDDMIYPNTALLGLRLLATDQLSGMSPKVTAIVKGRKVSAPDVKYSGVAVAWEDYYWDDSASEYKRFSDGASCTWDETTFVDTYCANPIWCMKDMLVNSRYGLGEYIDTLLIDDSQFLEMSRYCDNKLDDGDSGYEKRFTLNVVIDSSTRALDLINQLTATFNAFAFYSAGNVKFHIDKVESPVQVFGMGNIIEGSFNQTWKTIKETPNVIEVVFLDKDKGYERETIAVIDESSLTAGNAQRKRQLRLFTTNLSEVLRIGRYALKVAQKINRSITFKAGIDAIACQVGDLIDLAHDVPSWGSSGRVVSGTTSAVTIDQTVVIGAGTYKVEVRFADDTIEERTVTDGIGSYTTLNVTPVFSQAPSAYDVYAVGIEDIQTKPYRVVAIERSSEFEAMITAIEYIADVYDDTAVTLPDNDYSALTREIPDVTGLSADEENVVLADGTIGSITDISFAKPIMADYHLSKYSFAKIFMSDDAGVSWTQIGSTFNEFFRYEKLLVTGSTYNFAVVSVDAFGNENAIADSPQDSFTALGDALPPDDVTGFDVSQLGNQLNFEWDANSDSDIKHYVIKKGSDWATGQILAEEVDVTYFSNPIGEIGDLTFMIKAVDTSGNESDGFASDTITVTPPPEMSFQVDHDLFVQNLEYKLTDLALVKKNLHDADYVRNILSLDTATTWEELEAEAKGWGEAETDGDLVLDGTTVASGSYEMITPIDLETAFSFSVILDLDFINTAGGTITVQISYSVDGITYSDFETISASESYLGRYVRFKLLFATTDTSHQLDLYDCVFSISAPITTVAWGRDKAINNTGGITIEYGRTFTFIPRINATIVNGIEGIAIIDNKTLTTFDLQCKNLSGTGIDTAEVDWDAKGY